MAKAKIAAQPPQAELQAARFGAPIRTRRMAAKLRLSDLATLSGLSASYISQVERDRICPSIVALGRLAKALGTTAAVLLSEADTDQRNAIAVVRRGERRTLMFPKSDIRNELLVPSLQGALEVMWSRIPPGAKSPEFCHDGDECGIILTGRLVYCVGGVEYDLERGDAISHKSNIPHRYENRTKRTVETIWIVTPPGF